MRKLFNKEQEEFIRSNYQTMKYTTIANSLGFSERQVRGWINNHCDTKLRKFNSSYFEVIDTPRRHIGLALFMQTDILYTVPKGVHMSLAWNFRKRISIF